MAAHLCRTRAILQVPRAIPALIARTQATQATPSAGKGIPTPGNFNSATPPPPPPTGVKSTPSFGDTAAQQSFMNTPAGKIGAGVVLAIAVYAGYKALSGSKDDSDGSKDKKDQKGQEGQKDQAGQKEKKGQKDQEGQKDQKGQKDQEGQKDQKDKKDQKGQEGQKNQKDNKAGGGDQQANNGKGNDSKK